MKVSLTNKQRNKLVELSKGDLLRKGNEDDIYLIYELVRESLADNFVLMSGKYEWKFRITEQGREFLKE